MLDAVRRNFGLKVLSLLLAIVGWAYFRFANNPLIAARFDQQLSVPVAVVNLQPGYVARYPDKSVVVTVAPKRGEAPVKPEEIRAVLDLSNRTAGVYNVPVQVVAPNIAIQSRSPASQTITIDRIDQKEFPVAVHYTGQPNGAVSRIAVSPQSIQIHGPTGAISQIAAVRVDVPMNVSPAFFDEMIRPVAVDSQGDEVADIQVVPNLVRVQAQFVPSGPRK